MNDKKTLLTILLVMVLFIIGTIIINTKYNYNRTDYIIEDKSLKIKDFACDEALEEFYKDDNFIYYFPCIKSKYIFVKYENGEEILVKDALKTNKIKITELDAFEIEYLKEAINKNIVLIEETGIKSITETHIISDENNNYSLNYFGIKSATITIEGKLYDLEDAIVLKKVSIEEILNNMNLKEIYKDGGSKLYTSKPNIYSDNSHYYNILKCNTLDNNKDIYIGPGVGTFEMKYEEGFCK